MSLLLMQFLLFVIDLRKKSGFPLQILPLAGYPLRFPVMTPGGVEHIFVPTKTQHHEINFRIAHGINFRASSASGFYTRLFAIRKNFRFQN